MKTTLLAAVLLASTALMPVIGSAQTLEVEAKHSAATDQVADAQLDCFIAERPNTPAPFGRHGWLKLLVRCERQVQQWSAYCLADGNPAGFCTGKSNRLAQLIYSGAMVCDATNCRIAPGFTANVDRNGN